LVRVGLKSLAAGGAAFTISFVFSLWLTRDTAPLVASRAEPRTFVVDNGTVAESPIPNQARAHLASLDGDFTSRWQDIPAEPMAAPASFGERFAFDRPEPSMQASVSFDDRFGAESLATKTPARSAPPARRAVARAAAPRAVARVAAAPVPPRQAPKAGFQLASASETSLALGYAPADPAQNAVMTGSLNGLAPKDMDPLAGVDTSRTAIYDISSHTVYLPNGRRLEAHSGLGSHMDDPRSVALRNVGATPPNIYDLKMRESLFHGVRAIRLIPKDESKMYGRAGILAHTYMLGPNGQSNGCVSFSDYAAFLDAYQRGEVTNLVVVEHLAGAPSAKTASDWLSNKLKAIFQRS